MPNEAFQKGKQLSKYSCLGKSGLHTALFSTHMYIFIYLFPFTVVLFIYLFI